MTHKIWFQGATDRVHMAPYIAKVEAHLKSILDPGFSATFHSTTPPATWPVPSRGHGDAPVRVVHPKPHR